MQGILNFFKSRYFWIGFGFLLLVTLVVVLGGWMGWGWVPRLLVVIGLLVVGMAAIVIEFVRASRSAQQIEQSIKMQAEQQRLTSRPDKQGEIQELQERLDEAIQKLKQSKLGRGRRGKNALHALPWYMFIGPPAAGKTTAVKNSGLNFPVGTDGVRGVGGTRNCDWFFTDQAILLDTAGRYMTEHEDEEEWHAFLDMLKDHRRRRPINGVLVGISMDELVDAAPDEIEWHANTIRRRVSELVERLGVRFPIYLVFTKCDLLQGFVEFFGDLPRPEREQIWGCTLTDEQRDEGDLRAVFEREYDRLYDALVNARSERLSRSMKREERQRVYVFPLEFASAKENLALFVDQLFQQNPYQENPEFRGFYFTSGTQEGAPIDRVIQSISQQFDFAPGLSAGTQPAVEKKSYFIKDVFTDVVIPDQHRVEQTSSSARRGRLVRWGVGAAAAALLVLFAAGLSQALVRSQLDLSNVRSAAQEAALVQWDGRDAATDLERVDQLRQRVAELQRYEEDPPFMRWGLYRGGAVLEPTQALYYRTLRPLMRDQFRELERRVSRQGAAALSQQDQLALREDLKAYLLLSEEASRLGSEPNRTFLRSHLTEVATQGSGPFAQASIAGRGGQVEDQIAAFVDGVAREAVAPFEARSSVVAQARRLIYQKPTIGSAYARIKQEGEGVLQPLRLSTLLRQASSSMALFSTDPEVPGFFTKTGWETFVQERIEQEAASPGEGDWVLGERASEASSELSNPEEVTEQLRQRYFEEYASAWRQFLNQVEYRGFGDVRATARALATLGDPYNSPLLYVLAQATSQTTFGGSQLQEMTQTMREELEEQARARARTRLRSQDALRSTRGDDETAMHPVNRRLVWLHQLKAPDAVRGGADRTLTQALEALRRVGVLLDGMANDPARATELAAQVLSQNGGDLGVELRAIRSSLSRFDADARREFFERPIVEGWTAVLTTAQRHLNSQWEAQVYQPYQTHLVGRYPFEAGSDQDAALVHVEEFFRPQNGPVATFARERLEPFLRDDGRRPVTWEGRGLQVSPATIRMLDTVDEISNTLFAGGSLRLAFKLQPDTPERMGAPPADRVAINVHGTNDAYTMGYRPQTAFTWPGSSPGAMLAVRTRDGEMEPKRFEGWWAWFRLLEQAQIERRTSTEYQLRWRFDKPGQYSLIARYTLYDEKATGLYTSPSSFFRFSVPETIN